MRFKCRFDFYGVMARLSTIAALVSASTGAASAAFIVLPGQWQATFPDWAGHGKRVDGRSLPQRL